MNNMLNHSNKKESMIAGKYKWITGIVILITIVSSCKRDLLNVTPNDALSDATTFTDLQFVNRFLNNIYGTLPDGFARKDQQPEDANWSRGMTALEMASDDAECNNLAGSTHTLNQGVIPTTWSYAEDIWRQNYALIRKCNILIENIDQTPGDENLKARMKAEAIFMRAFAHAELIKCFGGVPLMLKAGTPDESIIPRNTYDQCVEQIVGDLDAAVPALPVVYPASELGRATKVAALALKARVLLYKASPLHNGGNNGLWQAAADAAREAMAYGPPPGTGDYDLHPDYYKTFIDKLGNKEIIWARKFQNPDISPRDGARNKWYMSVPDVNDGGWGGYSPTQNLVDAYEMTDGKLISDPTSTYDAQDPYKDRDSRLDKSILRNGSVYKKGIVVETFRGGNTNNANRFDSSKTGYGILKLIDTSKYDGNGNADNDWIFIRYAEVLLNYAEAQNEASGPDQSVFDAINKVRARSGQPALSGLPQDQLRERIRNERRVELSFEEHRFFDVRRWKLGSVYFNAPIYKVQITENGGNLIFNYPKWEDRKFVEYQNLLPIPQAEMDKNPLLEQNDGY